MGGDPEIIRLNCKPIATFFLWVTLLEISSEPLQSHTTPQQLIELRNQIHLTGFPRAVFYLDALLSYTDSDSDQVTACPGLEQAAGVASICLLHTLSSLDPSSWEFEDMRRQYIEVIPLAASFEGPFRHTKIAIHALLISSRDRQPFQWMDYKPCAQDHASFANTLAQAVYNRRQHGKVPRWVLHFTLHFLSQEPPPPMSVVADCLSIIAIDLGCDVSSVKLTALDERCVHIS